LQSLTRFRLPGFLLLCVCLVGLIGITIVQTRPAHADSVRGISPYLSGTWIGSGSGPGQTFNMVLNLQIHADKSISGTLQEGNDTVAITGSLTIIASTVQIEFTDPSNISGTGIALNVYYEAVYLSTHKMQGTWSYIGKGHPNGSFDLNRS